MGLITISSPVRRCGIYDTAAPGKGRGIRGGGYSMRISGFDGVAGPEAPFGKPLFPEHAFKKEFPAQKQTFDYEVKKPAK